MIKQEIINTSGCCCSLQESFTCTAPCGYPGREKAKEKEKLIELLQDMRAMEISGHSVSSKDYRDGWFNAIKTIEFVMLDGKDYVGKEND